MSKCPICRGKYRVTVISKNAREVDCWDCGPPPPDLPGDVEDTPALEAAEPQTDLFSFL